MASTPLPTTPLPPWAELIPELLAIILRKLGAVETLTSAQVVCKAWRSVCLEPATWSVINMRLDVFVGLNLFRLPSEYSLKFENLCCSAVDRSQGRLVSVSLDFIASDNLLNYIADRAPLLRSLRLVSCYNVSGEQLCLVVKKFPRLEDLQLNDMILTGEEIEAIGKSCPLLQSFGLNSHVPLRPAINCDEEAFAIAKSMPTLRHLQLVRNKMTDEGLNAILDCCLLLESLDLRQCFNVWFPGNVGKRCHERIQLLKCPDHSVGDDYEYDARVVGNLESSDEEDNPLGVSDIEPMSVVDDDYYEFSDTEYYDDAELVID